MHQSIVEGWACPPWEPDEGRIGQVAQAEFLQSCKRISFGQGQFDLLPTDNKLVQIRINLWHEIGEPRVQTAGSNCFQLFQTTRRLKSQIHIGLLLPESPEGIWSNAMPGYILGEADAQCP